MIRIVKDDDEPISVNRYAIILKPTDAYLEWAKGCPGGELDMELNDISEDCTVYLVPEWDSSPDAWLRRNFKFMFEDELDAWCTDPSFWPKDLSFRMFQKFFEVMLSSMVVDMGTEPLMHDD